MHKKYQPYMTYCCETFAAGPLANLDTVDAGTGLDLDEQLVISPVILGYCEDRHALGFNLRHVCSIAVIRCGAMIGDLGYRFLGRHDDCGQ